MEVFVKNIFLLLLLSASSVIANQAPQVVSPKDQTDVYGIPTDMDEVEEGQEMQSQTAKK
jgi:hypothetical protein